MDWKGRFRMGRTPAVGAAIVAGAALLVSPLAGAQAEVPESYYDEGYCYQSPDGQENASRLMVWDPDLHFKSDPPRESIQFAFAKQKWDAGSNTYKSASGVFHAKTGVDKHLLMDNAQYADANAFCKFFTEGQPDLQGEVYSHGVWVRKHPHGEPADPGGTGPGCCTEGQ